MAESSKGLSVKDLLSKKVTAGQLVEIGKTRVDMDEISEVVADILKQEVVDQEQLTEISSFLKQPKNNDIRQLYFDTHAALQIAIKEKRTQKLRGLFDKIVDFIGNLQAQSAMTEIMAHKDLFGMDEDETEGVEQTEDQGVQEADNERLGLLQLLLVEVIMVELDKLEEKDPLTVEASGSTREQSFDKDSFSKLILEGIARVLKRFEDRQSTAETTISALERFHQRINDQEARVNSASNPDLYTFFDDLHALVDAAIEKVRQDEATQTSSPLVSVDEEIELEEPTDQPYTPQPEASPPAVDLETETQLRQEIDDELDRIKQLGPVTLEVMTDRLAERLSKLYGLLDRIRAFGQDTEYFSLESRVLLCDYVETKRAIEHRMQDDELDLKNSNFYFQDSAATQSSGWDIVIAGERGFGRLNLIEKKASQNPVLSLKRDAIKLDNAAFQRTLSFRRRVFFAEQKLEPMIFGFGDQKTDSTRQFPQQTPEIFITEQDFSIAIHPRNGHDPDPDLQPDNEKAYVRDLPSRADSIRDFSSPDGFVNLPDFIPTTHGEVMRILDDLYKNKLHKMLKDKIIAEGRTPNQEEQQLIILLDNYYKSLHISSYKNNLHTVISRTAMLLYGYDISPLEVRQAWLFHSMLLHQSMMIPGKSPFTNDSLFKANQWLDYVSQGVIGGTTPASILESICLFRKYDPNLPPAADGKHYVLDNIGRYDMRRMKEPDGIVERIGFRLANLPDASHTSSARNKILTALGEKDLTDFEFLANLPLVLLHQNPQGNYQVIPMPLQYMIFRDPDTSRYSANPTQLANETPVMRWPEQPGYIPPPITAADFVNTDGRIMYEYIPWDLVLPSNGIEKWYNNGKNITRLYEMFSHAPGDSVLDVNKLPIEQNEVKYAASFFPVWGLEVSAGRFRAENVFRRITIVHVFSRCLTLLAVDKVKLKEVKEKLSYLTTAIGEDAVKAITVALDASFGTVENAQEMTELIAQQVEGVFKYQR